MKRLTAALAATILAALLAACGSPHHATPSTSKPHCKPGDTTLKCNLPAPTAPVTPAPQPEPVKTTSPTAVATAFRAPRLTYGIDFGWGGPSANTMRAHGWRFGASYLSFDSAKNWHVNQIGEYRAHAIARVYVWETVADRVLGGCLAGQSDALAARGQIGREARVIYFAVDFDEQASQSPTVTGYFRCAAKVLGVAHTGVYGGYWTVKRLLDARAVGYAWQTYAWSSGRWDPRAHLEQYLNGSSYDLDRAIAADYGQSPFASAPTRRQLEEQLWHLYRERRGITALIAARHAVLERHHCKAQPHPSHGCRTVKRLGNDSHRHLRAIEASINALHKKGIR